MDSKLLDVCGTTDKLALLLSAGDVRRYHQEGHSHPQLVNEHTWRVMVILLYFWPDASQDLILTALYHDVAERLTGDAPVSVKIQYPELRDVYQRIEKSFHQHFELPWDGDLNPEDRARLKVADYLELCITCKHRHGRRADQIYQRGKDLVVDACASLPVKDRDPVLHFLVKLETGAWTA